MGTVKDESRRKMKELCVRLTESDMETVRRNCRIAGYSSMSRFVRARLTYETPRKVPCAAGGEAPASVSVPEWLREETGRLSQQVRGVAANYNQAVAVMNVLVKNVEGRDARRLILRKAARLDTLTREMVNLLAQMKDIASKAADGAVPEETK